MLYGYAKTIVNIRSFTFLGGHGKIKSNGRIITIFGKCEDKKLSFLGEYVKIKINYSFDILWE